MNQMQRVLCLFRSTLFSFLVLDEILLHGTAISSDRYTAPTHGNQHFAQAKLVALKPVRGIYSDAVATSSIRFRP